MVAGRLYITGDVVRSRRAASVPAEHFSPEVDTRVLHKAHVISTNAVQDADAMRAASRQHDINFLNDISNKMAAATQPTHYYNESTPVYIGNRYPPPANHTTVTDYRRRSYAPQTTDYEVSNYLAGGPRGSRSRVSVTPVRGPSVPRWHAPSPSRSVRASSRGPSYSRDQLAPYEDVVVGVAHTSLYGDIVIGIPYHKKHMFDVDTNDLQRTSYKGYRPTNGIRHSIAASDRPTVVVPPSSRRSSIAAPASRKVLYDDVDEYLSSTPRYRSTKNYDIPNYGGEWTARPPSYSSRASSVHRQYDGAPEYSSHVSGVGSSTPLYSSTVNPHYSGSVGSSLPPPSTSSIPPRVPGKVSRPPVSEARRKVRDLLCKTKNDPHYFDGY